MDDYVRVSRRERRKLARKLKSWVALGLAAVTLGLFLSLAESANLGDLLTVNLRAFSHEGPPSAKADSVIVATGRGFRLTNATAVDTVLFEPRNGAKRTYHTRFRQPWPTRWPLVIYAERLHQMAKDAGFFCDCVEGQGKDSLDCVLLHRNAVRAEVLVIPAAQTKLQGRQMALIIDHLGGFKEDEVVRLVKAGIPFSYFAEPSVFPTRKARKALSQKHVSAIVKLPATVDAWRRLAGQKLGADKGNRVGDAVIDDVLQRHPSTEVLYFDVAGGVDTSLVRRVLGRARRKGISYLYTNQRPDAVDSLAYLMGLPIVRISYACWSPQGGADELWKWVAGSLVDAGGMRQRAVCVEGRGVSVSELVGLTDQLDRLGVEIVPCLRVAGRVESLERVYE